MPADFTVIFSTRQHFGNNVTDIIDGLRENLGETEAPFVGREKYYEFRCPNVESNENGIIVFQTLGVSWRHEITINDQIVYGGITRGATSIAFNLVTNTYNDSNLSDITSQPIMVWNTHSLVVSKNVLRTSNLLKISSLPDSDGRIDDFIIDNFIIHYKTN